ncbi:helix-turn-helix transcriptional regulator [Sphingomonas adhaesiva]|uniref:helix-turn-helix transcriptional regulator n=1 Tax=Sphingomonas adhaesiva TaxID=28212 RepID=UPI002FF632D7
MARGDEDHAWPQVEALADAVVALGGATGLPYLAAQSDLGDPGAMADRDGRPFAARFRWLDRDADYWRNRRLALEATLLHAARLIAEPFWYREGRVGTWRSSGLLDGVDLSAVTARTGVVAAVVAPVHLPGGRLGAVVWAADTPVDVAAVFAQRGEAMFAAAIRFLAAHAEWSAPRRHFTPGQLSAREAQCVRWAAAGKTNAEIGTILTLSVSTVRFHLRNAAEKLGAATRARMIQLATGHGFVGTLA